MVLFGPTPDGEDGLRVKKGFTAKQIEGGRRAEVGVKALQEQEQLRHIHFGRRAVFLGEVTGPAIEVALGRQVYGEVLEPGGRGGFAGCSQETRFFQVAQLGLDGTAMPPPLRVLGNEVFQSGRPFQLPEELMEFRVDHVPITFIGPDLQDEILTLLGVVRRTQAEWPRAAHKLVEQSHPGDFDR